MNNKESLDGIRGAWGYDVDSATFVDEIRSTKRGDRQMYIQYEEDYIDFGDYCRKVLGIQCQTGYYLLEGLAGHPKLKEGLRITGNTWNYHEIKIHKDDAEIFRQRYRAWLNRGTDPEGWKDGDEL